MKTYRLTDRQGRKIKPKDSNPSDWIIDKIEDTPGDGVRITYRARKQLSGASYALELSGAEVTELVWPTTKESTPCGQS